MDHLAAPKYHDTDHRISEDEPRGRIAVAQSDGSHGYIKLLTRGIEYCPPLGAMNYRARKDFESKRQGR